MHNRATYVMQDQVRDRVYSIMACDLRHPQGRWHNLPRQVLFTAGLTMLYAVALAAAG